MKPFVGQKGGLKLLQHAQECKFTDQALPMIALYSSTVWLLVL